MTLKEASNKRNPIKMVAAATLDIVIMTWQSPVDRVLLEEMWAPASASVPASRYDAASSKCNKSIFL